MDKAGRDYWDQVWGGLTEPAAIDPRSFKSSDEVNRRFHELFLEVFGPSPRLGSRLLEVGAARSQWLPYFAREFGFAVTGLDYSDDGCRQSRDMLRSARVDAEVVCADMFAPPSRLLTSFDVVFSLGVVEHFEDTTSALRALSTFLRPGGILLTIIPNMAGANGMLQRLLNEPVYRIHVPLTLDDLRKHYEAAGLRVIRSEFVMSTNFGVANLNGIAPGLGRTFRQAILGVMTRISMLAWFLERFGWRAPPSHLFAPYIVCVGTS